MTPDILTALNPEQRQAAEHINGPLLIIAGAGSGKTRTLVHRLAYIVQQGVCPENILLLTFTRKAAANMIAQAVTLLNNPSVSVTGGTFHSLAHQMLRRYSHLAGYSHNFTVLDRQDSLDILRLIVKEKGYGAKGRHFPSTKLLLTIASAVKNKALSASNLVDQNYHHLNREINAIEDILASYAAYKKANAMMDYDDLLTVWRDILLANDEVKAAVSKQFSYIMVDEYQDTNKAQAEIIRLMAFCHDNVMAVGDDAQSIYAFRGANFKNILEFPELFKGATIIKLVKNYRSTQPNLDCTNAIIANAKEGFAKKLIAHRQGGTLPVLLVSSDENRQAEAIAERIDGLIRQGISPSRIAVLFRAAFHSYTLETELTRRNINFVKRGGMAMAEASHIKDVVALLRLLINPLDRLNLIRALCLLPGLGPKNADKIYGAMLKADEPVTELAYFNTKSAWKAELNRLGTLLFDIREGIASAKITPKQALQGIVKWFTPYLETLYYDDYPKRAQELAWIIDLSDRYETLADMLADLAIEGVEVSAEEDAANHICLSTVHSAKGLEWDVVFLLSLAEGRFPSFFAEDRKDEQEEERRLFYVASTRARDKVFFCYPSMISVSGMGFQPAQPSRFLAEIPKTLITLEMADKKIQDTLSAKLQATRLRKQDQPRFDDPLSQTEPQSGQQPETWELLSTGMFVKHFLFGKGVVVKKETRPKVRVNFEGFGERLLDSSVAKLTILTE